MQLISRLELKHLNHTSPFVFSPDGTLLAYTPRPGVVKIAMTQTLHVGDSACLVRVMKWLGVY
jgi:hypothetical protein